MCECMYVIWNLYYVWLLEMYGYCVSVVERMWFVELFVYLKLDLIKLGNFVLF